MILSSEQLAIKGVRLFTINSYSDDRGYFLEVFKSDLKYKEFNIDYVQENESKSKYGVFRGMHFQKGKYSQSKLIRVVKGKVLDFIYDLRRSSPSFKKFISVELNNNNILFLPKGIAHGFLSLKDDTLLNYKCDNYYNPSSESGFSIFKSDLKNKLILKKENIIISKKDIDLPSLNESYFFD